MTFVLKVSVRRIGLFRADEVQFAMEEISNKEKELRALVQVTSVLYERNSEMATKIEEAASQLEILEQEKMERAEKDHAIEVSHNFYLTMLNRQRWRSSNSESWFWSSPMRS